MGCGEQFAVYFPMYVGRARLGRVLRPANTAPLEVRSSQLQLASLSACLSECLSACLAACRSVKVVA